MEQNVLKVNIKRDNTLFELEDHNRCMHEKGKGIHMYLSSDYEKKFFNTTWISSLIATASDIDKDFVITDRGEKGSNENINLRFSSNLIGITSACLARRIENTRHEKMELDVESFIWALAHNNQGLIENPESSGREFIFCAFDSNNDRRYFPRPGALSANNVSEFTEKFLRIKRNKIDRAFGIENQNQPALFSQYDTYENEKNLAALVYELFENTIQHGNKDEEGNLIEGVRTLTIKRHIFNQQAELSRQSDNFLELSTYFTNLSDKTNKNLKFYEISILDNGIGMVKRFLASRPEYRSDPAFSKLSDFEKLNFIITTSLSSKMLSGAGRGVKNALKNLMKLNGFVSLRTNDIWAYFDGTSKLAKIDPCFTKVNTRDALENMRGTSYSIIIPVSSR